MHTCAVCFPVIIGQTVFYQLGQRAIYAAVGFPHTCHTQHGILFGFVKFRLRHRFFFHKHVHLFHDFHRAFFGFVGLNRCINQEWTLTTGIGNKRTGAISPVFVFANVHVDPTGKIAAQHIVHLLNGVFIQLAIRLGQIARYNHRLLAFRTVDQENFVAGRAGFYFRNYFFRNIAFLPGTEAFFQFCHQFFHGQVARNDQSCIVWTDPVLIKTADIFQTEGFNRIFITCARHRHAIRMVFAVQQFWHYAHDHRLWFLHFIGNRAQLLVFQTVQIRFRESRIQNDVCHDVQTWIQRLLQGVQTYIREVEVAVSIQGSAQQLQFFIDLQAAEGFGTFIQHVHRQVCQTWFATKFIGTVACVEHHAHYDGWAFSTTCEDHFNAVFQSSAL